MPRNLFIAELENLHNEIRNMGDKISHIISNTITALKKHDEGLSKNIFSGDGRINTMNRKIEQTCLNMIALQQPIASDLRAIASTLKILTDMERIADQCADICEIILSHPDSTSLKPPAKLIQMMEAAQEMFGNAVSAYLEQDVVLARAVCKSDDCIDAIFSQLILELCAIMPDNELKIPTAVDYMFIAKYVERIGDHATNIAEWGIYLATGEHPDLNTEESVL